MGYSMQREIKLIQECYDKPAYAPIMRWNSKYYNKEFEGMTPYICIDDLVDYKYVISAMQTSEVEMFLQEMNRRAVVKEYESLADMVSDGWRIDC